MEEIFIQQQGFNKTFIHSPAINNKKKINWDMTYDGNQADINLESNNNGLIQKYELQLDKNDLEDLLSIPSEPISIDKRLKNDFLKKYSKTKPTSKFSHSKSKNLPFTRKKKYTHLSSPLLLDNYLVPNKRNSKNKSFKKIKNKYPSYSIYKIPNSYSRKKLSNF